MASTKLMQTKDGKRFFMISVSRGRGLSNYTMRWYWPDGWSKAKAEKELNKVAVTFEKDCKEGKVRNRAEQKALEAEAAAELKRIEAEKAAERAKLKTFKSYALEVYMTSKERSLSENARSSYMMFLEKHIFPVFGDMLLTEISTAMIDKLLLDFQKQGYKQATVTKLFNVLNGVFKKAFRDGSISFNPMLMVDKPTASKDEQSQTAEDSEKALTVEQLQYVLSCVDQEDLKWRSFIYLLVDTGMRRGEACGLQWQDIDFSSGLVQIRRNLQYTPAAGIYETSPKNGKARTVDIGSDVLALLRQLRSAQAESCFSKWVFTQPGSPEPMHPQSPTRYFSKFGKRYGIANFHPHLLRHTSASIAITNGADVVSTSARLGHSDTSVTLKMYAHANQESIRRAGQAVRDALKNA